MKVDHILLGSGISSLVCANELVKKGCKVALITTNAPPGGHFSPYNVMGQAFDMGMVLLEFDSYREQFESLQNYDPSRLGSVGSYSRVVEDYLAPYFEPRQVQQMGVALRGRIIGDYFISNDLRQLPEVFSSQETTSIIAELESAVTADNCHPSLKAGPGPYDTLCYEEASRHNHGETLHRVLMEPLINRVTGLDSSALSARYHRLFWAPLYYPESLLKSFRKAEYLPSTAFHHPVGATVGELSRSLFEGLQQAEGCTIINQLDSLSLESGSWVINQQLRTNQLSSSLPQQALANLMGIESDPLVKSSYLFVFLRLNGPIDCEVLFNASGPGHFFRIVNQSRVSGYDESTTNLVVEYNLDAVMRINPKFVEEKAYLKEIANFIEQHKLGQFDLLESAVLALEKKMVLPTDANVKAIKMNTNRLVETSIDLMGPSAGIGGSSLNDQVVQALKYVEAKS